MPDSLKVDIQYSSAHNDWPRLRDAVLADEATGFYSTTWIFDHFEGAMLDGDRDLLECCTLLGALAATTTTIGIGTLVANVANRHPAVLAAAAASAQRISNGRVILGLGAGTAPGTKWSAEHQLLEIPLRERMADRHAAVAAQIAAMRSRDASVPVIVGVNSEALAHIAGEVADGINVRMSHPKADRFVAAAREAAGDKPFDVSGWAFGSPEENHADAERLGLDRLVITRLGALP